MAINRSFKDYVANCYYNELYSAVDEFLQRNFKSLDFPDDTVRYIDYADLSDVEVKSVRVEDSYNMGIKFDVLVESEIEFGEKNNRNERYDQSNMWFKLSCKGDLSGSLKDFTIYSVSVYENKSTTANPLSDGLVPYIKSEQLESVAQDFLSRHYPEALKVPMAVEPHILAERMGLTIQSKNITDDFSIFGQIFFSDCDAEFYNKNTQAIETVSVKSGTIFVDPEAYFLRNLGSVNNTIIHECVHWDKHRKAFELERLYNENATQIKCQVVGGIRDRHTKTDADWMEWQANSLAPKIQMPFVQTKAKAAELIKKYQSQKGSYNLIDVIEPVIEELSTFFVVSRQAAKIRMIDLGYEEAIGAFTYIDGRYVKPHTFKKGTIKRNQTFSISRQDALIQSAISLELRSSVQSGNYVFVDSHFCINNPKYVGKQADGEVILTDYARLHMDECCLVFDLKILSTDSCGEKYYTECVLYRDAKSGITFEAQYSSSENNAAVINKAEMLNTFVKEISDLMATLPSDFAGTLKVLMKWRDTTNEQLAEDALMSSKTIQRLRNEVDYIPTLEYVVALCIGLQLPPILSDDLIRKSGRSFKAGSDAHLIYQFLLASHYSHPIRECNEILVGQNMKPLGTDE